MLDPLAARCPPGPPLFPRWNPSFFPRCQHPAISIGQVFRRLFSALVPAPFLSIFESTIHLSFGSSGVPPPASGDPYPLFFLPCCCCSFLLFFPRSRERANFLRHRPLNVHAGGGASVSVHGYSCSRRRPVLFPSGMVPRVFKTCALLNPFCVTGQTRVILFLFARHSAATFWN